MKHNLSSFLLRVFFWDTEKLHNFDKIDKAIVVVAPHTSIWDFIIGKLVVNKYHRKCVFFIKKEAFSWFIIGKLLKKWGGIPIDRGHAASHVDSAVEALNSNDQLWVILTPEGTRKKVNRWKSGFHRIAFKAQVPILISYIDYKKRKATVVAELFPTEDYDADIRKILSIYEGIINLNNK